MSKMIRIWKRKILQVVFFGLCFSELKADSPPYKPSFVTCAINSQLGNQIFAISTALVTGWEYGAIPVFPQLKKTEFNIPLHRKKIFFRLNDTPAPNTSWNYFPVPGLDKTIYFQPIDYVPNTYIDGWNWMTRYFDPYKSRLINTFAPSGEEEEIIQQKYGELLKTENVVAVHVRAYNPIHFHFLGFDYFKRAMDRFPEETTFAIFSCRMEFTKKHLAGYKPNMVFIEGNDHVRDFFVMNKCKHHIISNSTFSFWAAYLKEDPEQVVIAPDLYQPHMERFSGSNGAYPMNWTVLPVSVESGLGYDEIANYSTTSIHGG